MESALRLASSHGLQCEPVDLLLLLLPPDVLEDQVPMGRHLLQSLEETGIRCEMFGCTVFCASIFIKKNNSVCRQDEQKRRDLLGQVQRYLLDSDDYWEKISSSRSVIAKRYDASLKGKKGEVLNAFEKHVDAAKQSAYCPTLLQIVYRSGARQHVMVERYVSLPFHMLIFYS